MLSAANKPLELADLQADPAYALRMPGADGLAEVGAERRLTPDGAQSPFAGHIFGTLATSAEVYAFYERVLARLGWRPETPPFSRSTAELENRLYCAGRATFRLAIEDKDRAFQQAFYHGRTYLTVFDARLIGESRSSSCPSAPRSPPPTLIP